MKEVWLLALLSRAALARDAEHVARRFRDVLTPAEVLSAVHLGMVQAVARFDPQRGRFRDWARPFVVGAVYKTVRRELRWRKRFAGEDALGPSDPRTPDLATYRRELRELLGDDYDTFMGHFAYGESMRELGRATERSFRAVRESLARASRRVERALGHMPGTSRLPRRSGPKCCTPKEASLAEPPREPES